MFKSYNRLYLRESRDIQEQLVYNNSLFPIELKGLEWNQYIGRIIINDFIKQLDKYDGTDFAQYIGVLPYIEYGMFQSAIKIIKTIEIPGLERLKKWLIKSLEEGEDRYE